MDYENFNAKDFILDEYFQEWVLAPTAETTRFWTEWLRKNPDKKNITEQARQAILSIQFQEYLPEERQKARVWENISRLKNVSSGDEEQKMVIMHHKGSRREKGATARGWMRAAAVLLVLAITGAIYFLNYITDEKVALHTDYGQTKMVVLSDGSRVHLNANSRIWYKNRWNTGESRELWLEGEAYFSVSHQLNDQKFIVHTRGLQVEVLGTEFNVKNRRDVTNVVLLDGKVKIEAPGLEDTAKYIMQPGELVQFAATRQEMTSKRVSPEQYVSWKDHQLKFEETRITEIAQMIEENYGYKVVLDDVAMQNLKFTGTVPSERIDYLLVALSESFQLEVKKKKKIIQFSYPEN